MNGGGSTTEGHCGRELEHREKSEVRKEGIDLPGGGELGASGQRVGWTEIAKEARHQNWRPTEWQSIRIAKTPRLLLESK